MPEVKEMQCPITDRFSRTISCELWMDRNELGAHLSQHHTNYSEDPEPWFEAEQERQFK